MFIYLKLYQSPLRFFCKHKKNILYLRNFLRKILSNISFKTYVCFCVFVVFGFKIKLAMKQFKDESKNFE
ncbi:MAG: hypothetical protein C4K58_04020 [Flavobacteriaceae bacterium]|nr:MAG: hypothetical protein C4K58_04020 [Flavobacteriaceae bacterium]